MTGKDSGKRDVLGDIAGIAAGFGMLALAAVNVIAASKRGPKVDHRPGAQSLGAFMRERRPNRRKPPEAGTAAPAVSPRGPVPRHGGAGAMLDFEA